MRLTQLSFPLRAAVAFAMLVGVYVLSASLLVAMLALDALSLGHPGFLMVSLWSGTVGLLVALRRTFLVRRRPAGPPYGLAVTRQQEPRLWGVYDEAAGATGTRPPDELWLVPEVNAGVSETRSAGEAGTRRRALLGLPLLVGLTEPELRAVVAHEMAHYSGRDTRLSPVVYRGSRAMARLIAETQRSSLLGGVLRHYGKAYFRVAGAINRRQELAADALAAQVAGADPAISALRRLPVLERAWDYYVVTFLGPAAGAGCVPLGALSLFETLLRAPQPPDHPLARALPEDAAFAGPYDTHPPTAARVAALAALPRTGAPGQEARAAGLLLDAPGEVVTRFDALLADGGALQLVPWQDLGERVAPRVAARPARLVVAAAESLLGTAPVGLGEVLTAAQERPEELGQEMLGTQVVADPARRTEQAREAVAAGVRSLLASALVAAGAASWSLSLEGRPYQVVASSGPVDLTGLAAEGLSSPEGLQLLRRRLEAVGVDLGFRVEPSEQDRVLVGQRWLASLAGLSSGFHRVDVVIRTDGIVVLRAPRLSRTRARDRLAALRDLDPSRPGALGRHDRWWRPEQLQRVDMRGNGLGGVVRRQWRVRVHHGARRALTVVIENAGNARIAADALQRLMGERFRLR